MKLDPIASDFYTRYSIDALAGTAQHVNAHSSISFIGAEYNPLFAFPGGTSGQARALVRWLIPDSFEGKGIDQVLANPLRRETLDRAGQKVRIRTESIVLRVDQESRGKKSEANVIYHRGGQFHRVRAKAVVVAGQSHSARHLIEQLADQKRKDAWKEFHQVPVVVANVVVKSSTPFMDAGCGYNQYWWGSKYWADFVMADWATPNRKKKDRPTVLTFLGSNTAPPEEMPAERFKLLNTPFGEYEKSLKGDLSRVMSGTKFDFDRDVSAIYLYRWGHSMIFPSVGFPFGIAKDAKGKVDRSKSPRHIARAQMGRISFAGQDTEANPSVECAMSSGLRVAKEVIRVLFTALRSGLGWDRKY